MSCHVISCNVNQRNAPCNVWQHQCLCVTRSGCRFVCEVAAAAKRPDRLAKASPGNLRIEPTVPQWTALQGLLKPRKTLAVTSYCWSCSRLGNQELDAEPSVRRVFANDIERGHLHVSFAWNNMPGIWVWRTIYIYIPLWLAQHIIYHYMLITCDNYKLYV